MPRVPKIHVTTLRAPLLGALLVLVVGATAFAASRQPTAADLALDGTLRVALVDWLGAAPEPVANAEVEVAAVRDGAVLGITTTTTGASGVATLTGLPRATAGSPVELHVIARRSGMWVDADGCARSESWAGDEAVVRSGIGASVELEVVRASSTLCGPQWNQEVAGITDTMSEPAPTGGVPAGVPLGAWLVIAAALAAAAGLVLRLRRIA